ncbi:ATP-binding cassette domain-containing protein [Curtanaerobium respiraculi]|uniref:ATP-binding cassette domain-containing protein n=1 Tax=Curtanaerobium respiraculi TaxID=2949669 RepID=UPI0024B36F2A|nr:ATP-binding cassette domain-containing protein [Curtanaerobium respiraculi]
MEKREVERYLLKTGYDDLIERFPYLENMFSAIRISPFAGTDTVIDILNSYPDESFTDYGFTKTAFATSIIDFIDTYGFEEREDSPAIASITIRGGHDKDGYPEGLDVTVRAGEVVCIVGPTGSGKSRLLEDVESLAQDDTPSGRSVLVNGEAPSEEMRARMGRRMIAQITQNMNFVIDLTVAAFVSMHAQSRNVFDPCIIDRVIACANELSGEHFEGDTPITQLSGGQSRALMVADTVVLSESPIVLIDEIENAGIDRAAALSMLVDEGKIVLLSTHDPVLALGGCRRLVIENGAVKAILESTPEERKNLSLLRKLDSFMLSLRNGIRGGERLDDDLRARLHGALSAAE